jgi:hypothetical protein
VEIRPRQPKRIVRKEKCLAINESAAEQLTVACLIGQPQNLKIKHDPIAEREIARNLNSEQ